MTRKEKLKQALAAIVDAMLPEDRPTEPPAPPPQPAPHRAYLKADMSMCCQMHDDAFDRHARADASIRLIPLAWVIGREPDPPPPAPAWKPPGADPRFVEDLRRRAARWFGRS